MPRAVRPCVYAVPCVMLVCGASQRARSTAPTLLAREMRRSGLRPPRSAIARLRSGAVASWSGAFRIAAFRCGGGGPRGWHRRAGASARRSLRADACAPFGFGFAESSLRKLRFLRRIPVCPCGVGCAPHPPMSGIRLGRNTSRRRLPPLCGDARIPPPVRAPAPFPPRVHLRAIGTCPFLRCAFRAPYGEQGVCVARNCTESPHDVQILTRPAATPS